MGLGKNKQEMKVGIPLLVTAVNVDFYDRHHLTLRNLLEIKGTESIFHC